jgi:hypothetical protein
MQNLVVDRKIIILFFGEKINSDCGPLGPCSCQYNDESSGFVK